MVATAPEELAQQLEASLRAYVDGVADLDLFYTWFMEEVACRMGADGDPLPEPLRERAVVIWHRLAEQQSGHFSEDWLREQFRWLVA